MSSSNLNKPIYLASFIVHSESALGCDDSADSTAKANPGLSAPRLETVLTQPTIGKGVSSIARQIEEEESSNTIKLEDLAKLVSHVQPSFKDLDTPKDDPVIIVDEDEETEKDEVHPTLNAKTKDTSHKLELEKNKAEAEATLLKAQAFFPNVEQLKELLDLPSKLNELTREVKGLKKQVHELEIELLGDLKEIPTKLDDFTKNVASIQAKLKTLNDLPILLLNVTQTLNKFAQVLDSASSKAGDQSVHSAGQANTMPAEGEKNTNQATITYFSKNSLKKNPENENPEQPNNQITHQPLQPSFLLQGQKGQVLKEDAEEKKELKKFNFVTKSGEHVHLTKEHISVQKKIEEEAKAEAAKHEGEMRKEELIDLLGLEVVNKYYNDKL
ncbi:hypothetical protein Tco_0950138 [Tanacetum coccineum]